MTTEQIKKMKNGWLKKNLRVCRQMMNAQVRNGEYEFSAKLQLMAANISAILEEMNLRGIKDDGCQV